MSIKTILLVLLLLGNFSYAQIKLTEENHDSYWFYRYRLTNQFLRVGEQSGNSLPASIRNPHSLNHLGCESPFSHGDQGINFGYYLAVLATEYRMLLFNKEYKDLEKTKYELYCAIKALYRLDYYAETHHPWDSIPNFNGYFNRTEIPLNYVADFDDPNGNYQHFNQHNEFFGMPDFKKEDMSFGYYNDYTNQEYRVNDRTRNEASQDQWISIFMGLAMIEKFCLDEDSIVKPDQSIASVTEDWTTNFGHFKNWAYQYMWMMVKRLDKNGWILTNPNDDWVHTGADLYLFSYPIIKIMNNMGEEHMLGTNWHRMWNISWDGMAPCYQLTGEFARSFTTILAGLSDSWGTFSSTQNNIERMAREGRSKRGSLKRCLNTGEYHFNEKMSSLKTYDNEWEGFSLSFWKAYNDGNLNTRNEKNVERKVNEYLSTVPSKGIHYQFDNSPGYNPNTRWSSTNKFTKNGWKQLYGDPGFRGYYNGLDYMLLHNLVYINKYISNSYDQELIDSLPHYENRVHLFELNYNR